MQLFLVSTCTAVPAIQAKRKKGEVEDVHMVRYNLNLREAGLFCAASLVLVRWSWAATTSGGGLNRFMADT